MMRGGGNAIISLPFGRAFIEAWHGVGARMRQLHFSSFFGGTFIEAVRCLLPLSPRAIPLPFGKGFH